MREDFPNVRLCRVAKTDIRVHAQLMFISHPKGMEMDSADDSAFHVVSPFLHFGLRGSMLTYKNFIWNTVTMAEVGTLEILSTCAKIFYNGNFSLLEQLYWVMVCSCWNFSL